MFFLHLPLLLLKVGEAFPDAVERGIDRRKGLVELLPMLYPAMLDGGEGTGGF
jgi:hypothetical protein